MGIEYNILKRNTDPTIDSVDVFSNVYEEFNALDHKNAKDSDFIAIIKDFIENIRASGLIDQSFKKIETNFEKLEKLSEVKDSKTIDIIKYIIKTDTIIGKLFWKNVIEKIKNEFHDKSFSGKASLEERNLPIDRNLTKLENIFLSLIAEKYLKNKLLEAKNQD